MKFHLRKSISRLLKKYSDLLTDIFMNATSPLMKEQLFMDSVKTSFMPLLSFFLTLFLKMKEYVVIWSIYLILFMKSFWKKYPVFIGYVFIVIFITGLIGIGLAISSDSLPLVSVQGSASREMSNEDNDASRAEKADLLKYSQKSGSQKAGALNHEKKDAGKKEEHKANKKKHSLLFQSPLRNIGKDYEILSPSPLPIENLIRNNSLQQDFQPSPVSIFNDKKTGTIHGSHKHRHIEIFPHFPMTSQVDQPTFSLGILGNPSTSEIILGASLTFPLGQTKLSSSIEVNKAQAQQIRKTLKDEEKKNCLERMKRLQDLIDKGNTELRKSLDLEMREYKMLETG